MENLIPIVVNYASGNTLKAVLNVNDNKVEFVGEDDREACKNWYRLWYARAAEHETMGVTDAQ